MDPLSLAASIIAVMTLATQTSKYLSSVCKLRKAPLEVLELSNEIAELQALLSLVQKVCETASPSMLLSKDQELITRLVESGREPLSQLNGLIKSCCRSTAVAVAGQEARVDVSLTAWLKSRNSVEKIRCRLLRANWNIITALTALNIMYRQEDQRLILKLYDLVSDHVRASEAQTPTNNERLEGDDGLHQAVFEQATDTPAATRIIFDQDTLFSPTRPGKLYPPLFLENGRARCPHIESKNSREHSSGEKPVESHSNIWDLIGKEICAWTPWSRHIRRKGAKTSWATKLLGILVYNQSGFPILRQHQCRRPASFHREAISYQLIYHFPCWVAQRTITLAASYRHLGGQSFSWSFSLQRSIPASHEAWQCIERNQSDRFLHLLRKGSIFANDMADDDGTSLLIYALKFRSHNIIGLLLTYGASLDYVDPRGVSTRAYAQSIFLLDRPMQKPRWFVQTNIGVDEPTVADELEFSPLHYIVVGLEQSDLHTQLRLNSDCVNSSDSFGWTPLHWAVATGNSIAVEVLLQHGASPAAIDKEQMTPLHHIFLAPSAFQAECALLLLVGGAEVDALDAWERTPLRIAVGYDNTSVDLLAALIEHGASVNHKDVYSQSPLLKSILGSTETTRLLLENGADIEAQDTFGNAPVLEAVYRNRPEKLKMLIERGAKISHYFELKPGRRPRDGPVHILDFIVWYGSIEAMQIMEASLKHGYRLLYPIDDFENYGDFRLAFGRKAGEQERETLRRILSKVELASPLHSHKNTSGTESSDDDGTCEDETFFDAHGFLEEACVVRNQGSPIH